MRAALAVARRELGAAVDSPAAWIAGGAFVLALHALFFLLGYPVGPQPLPGLWEGGVASLQSLFHWLPLAFVGLAPALAMGAWSEERRSGTEELLLTWPVPTGAFVLGKFLAHLALLAVLLVVAVLPPAVVVATLGPLDWGVVAGGLLGAVLTGGGALALALLVSALSRDPLPAFLLGALLLGALWAADLAAGALPGSAAAALNALSPAARYLDGAARGVLDARHLLHPLLVGAVALSLNGLVVEGRRRR